MLTKKVSETHAKEFLIEALGGDRGEAVYKVGMEIGKPALREKFFKSVVLDLAGLHAGNNTFAHMKKNIKWRTQPVSVRQFVEDPYFLNKGNEVYPIVMDYIEEMSSGKYIEVVLTGGIGSAKTTIAIYLNAYQVYLLSCMRNPHAEFGLDSSHEIEFIFQSITAALAKGVDFMRFKDMIQKSPYFQNEFPFDRNLESEMRFPNRIIVKPVSGSDSAAIGQNVIGGLIDELNYMSVTENSKASVDGGTYDQAVAVYNSIARRRKSRFLKAGKLPGILCLVSSKRYPGQFTDIKEAERDKEVAEKGTSQIYVYDKRVWDIKPDDFLGIWFRVFIGDDARKPRMLEEGEEVHEDDAELVKDIPIEFKPEFETDIIDALREIAGVSTLARHPFILETEAVSEAMSDEIYSIFNNEKVDFKNVKLSLLPDMFVRPDEPRWVHIDLAVTGDSAGIAIGHVKRFVNIDRGDVEEILPEIHLDGTLEVSPPKNGEIIFGKIRAMLYKLKQLGLNIQWVSFDQYQSRDSQQILRQKGFITGQQSIDSVPSAPYYMTKTALYDRRLIIPRHDKLRKEFVSLEKDPKTGKIDHPPNGSNDVADAVAGVVYGLTMRTELWIRHKLNPSQIPNSVIEMVKKDNMKAAEVEDMEEGEDE
jgi:hypothetical protein